MGRRGTTWDDVGRHGTTWAVTGRCYHICRVACQSHLSCRKAVNIYPSRICLLGIFLLLSSLQSLYGVGKEIHKLVTQPDIKFRRSDPGPLMGATEMMVAGVVVVAKMVVMAGVVVVAMVVVEENSSAYKCLCLLLLY